MANPQVIQGTLNRLLANVVYADFPQLNVTAPYLAKEAISMSRTFMELQQSIYCALRLWVMLTKLRSKQIRLWVL